VFSSTTQDYTETEQTNASTTVDGFYNLGAIYNTSVDAQDLGFEFTILDGPTESGSVVYVPEPTSIAIIGLAGVALLVRPRRRHV